jgi:hypothetical protein
MYIGLRVKEPLVLLDFKQNLIFRTGFRKTIKCQISQKSVQWELSSSMRSDGQTDRQTDMTKLMVAICEHA